MPVLLELLQIFLRDRVLFHLRHALPVRGSGSNFADLFTFPDRFAPCRGGGFRLLRALSRNGFEATEKAALLLFLLLLLVLLSLFLIRLGLVLRGETRRGESHGDHQD